MSVLLPGIATTMWHAVVALCVLMAGLWLLKHLTD